MDINIASNKQEIEMCFDIIKELRPHLTFELFHQKIQTLKNTTGYQLIYLIDTDIKAVAGIRVSEWLHTGKYLEIEELVTQRGERSKGYGSKLFDWIVNYSKELNCNQVRLVSGVIREKAHKFYLDKGMVYEAKYFSINVDSFNS